MKKIESTTNYNIFKFIKCNRQVDMRHVRRIVEKIKGNNLLNAYPILVDKDYNVIDGQHRLKAAEYLELPVYYCVEDHVSVADIGMLNSTQKPWLILDYINHYAALGNINYIKLKNLIESRHIRHNIVFKYNHTSCALVKNGSYKYFDEESEKKFLLDLDKCDEIKNLIKRHSFIHANPLNSILESEAFSRSLIAFIKRDDVDFKYFMKNFELNIQKFKKCGSREHYYELFLNIYNHNRKNKIEYSKEVG